MNNKELLKLKLAEAVNSVDTSYAPQAREELSRILRHGSERDIALVKEASKMKALKSYFQQAAKVGKDGKTTGFNPSSFERHAKQLAAAGALAGAIGAAGSKALKFGKKVSDARKLKKMSPLKRALVKGFGKDTIGRKALMFGGGAAGISAGIKGVEGLSDSISKPIKKRSAFKKMMADNPSLRKEDPKDVKKVFNTLFRFNPKMAGDPLVAGSFMKRTLQFKDEGIQPVDVKTLTEVGRNMQSNKSNSSLLSAAFLSGAKDLANFAG